jgi:hypothetical protein
VGTATVAKACGGAAAGAVGPSEVGRQVEQADEVGRGRGCGAMGREAGRGTGVARWVAGAEAGSWAAGGEEEADFLFYLFIFFSLFLFISFPISSRCRIEFLIKPMLHKITHQTK